MSGCGNSDKLLLHFIAHLCLLLGSSLSLLAASAERDVFLIRYEATISASATHRWATFLEDGYKRSETEATDELHYRHSGEQQITIDRRWEYVESATASGSGGGFFKKTDYPRASEPVVFDIDWSYTLDPERFDPTDSGFHAGLSRQFEECSLLPSSLLQVKLSPSFPYALAAATQLLSNRQRLYDEPIQLPTDRTSYTVTRTFSTNLVISYDDEGGTPGHTAEVTSGHAMATYTATVTIQRNPAELEAVILPDIEGVASGPKYADWLPLAGANEAEPGNRLMVRVILREKGSTDTQPVPDGKASFSCSLDASREPGVCLNWPGKDKAVDTPDLQFQETELLTVMNEGQYAESTRNDLNEIILIINSFDYGAFGSLTVTALIQGVGEVRAYVEGDKTKLSLAIPKDNDGNRIADAWEEEQIGLPSGLPAAWDEAPWPSGHSRTGDGISLFEKYRGFMFHGVHERLYPMVKHLFVYDASGAVIQMTLPNNRGSSFVKASNGVRLRFVRDDAWTGPGAASQKKRIVNFNSSGFAHAVDQHALHVRLQSARNPVTPPEYHDMYKEKFGKGPPAEDLRLTLGMAWPDQTTTGARSASPQDTFLIEAYLDAIDDDSRQTVSHNTWSPEVRARYSAASGAEKARIWEETTRDAAAYLAEHRAEVSQRYWFHLSQVLCHELGHGIGIDDLKPPNDQGPTNCVMRYLGYGDFLGDPTDRLELKRRWTSTLQPLIFCQDPAGTRQNLACYRQIQVADRAGDLVTLGRPTLQAMALPAYSLEDETAGLLAIPSYTLAEADPPMLAIAAGLEWAPVLEDDPLRLTVQLSSPFWQQLAQLDHIHNAADVPTSPMARVAGDWADGVQLNLYKIEPDGSRTLVLSQEKWRTFRRELAVDASLWDPLLATRSREWMAPGEAAALSQGKYVLTVAWDARALAPPEWVAEVGLLAGTDIEFEVEAIADERERACHLRRLAFQKWDVGEDQAARQLALEALILDPGNRQRDAIESSFVLASSNARLQDYHGAARAVLDIAERFPEMAQTELVRLARLYSRMLAPELKVKSVGDGLPTSLTVIGQRGQRYALQVSDDLRTWSTLQTLITATNRVEVSDPNSRDDQRYYRLEWLPQLLPEPSF